VGRNRERDAVNRASLEAKGWRVEMVWECELKDAAALESRLKSILHAP
jgi:DNA mismatch endonuclease (patch repair protein)